MSPSSARHPVLLYGYAGRQPADLLDAVKRLDAIVLDIRYSPRSRTPEWSGARLRALFGERYQHLRAFGNVDYQHNRIRLEDAEAGILAVREMLSESSVVLMCQCKDGATCHRAVVGALLRERLGVEVIELDAALAESEPKQTRLLGGAA